MDMSSNISCGTSPIVGLRFSLHPMADNFIEIIKGALDEADTSNVWMHTDDVSTVMRGKEIHVFDTAKAIILHASKTGVHVAFNGTFSIGCPGDTAGDVYLEKDDVLLNESKVTGMRQYVSSQFSLYPMNNPNYMSVIYKEVDRAKELGVFNESMHYASGLHGEIHNVFAFLEETFANARSDDHRHLVMTVNMSINSPSHEGSL
jgi:energy-coupling factor transport system substrate-specific component